VAKKLTKKETKVYRDLLLDRRNRLTGSMDSIGGSVSSQSGERDSASGDEADLGSMSVAQEFALSMLQNESGAVQKIDAALRRIDDGEFGFCDDCEEPIAKPRLEAIPWTTLCIDCQREGESH
jgi:DnaK suppressor protein